MSVLAERGEIITEGAMSWFDFCLGVLNLDFFEKESLAGVYP